MRNIILLLVVILALPLSGCLAYVAAVAVTSRQNAEARQECIDEGYQWVDGSSWGVQVGKCMRPSRGQPAKVITNDAEKCRALGGIYYASTGGCDFAQHSDLETP